MSATDAAMNAAVELFNPNDLMAFFQTNSDGVHPVVQAIKNTCTNDNQAYQPDINQFDPLCGTWIELEGKMGHSWTQAIGIMICFGLLGTFYAIFLLANSIGYIGRNVFASSMDDYTRYNSMNV